MPIKFAVKIVRLKVYVTTVSPMTLHFTQGHKCVSNVTSFYLAIFLTIFMLLLIQTWHGGRPIHSIYADARFDDPHDLDTRS